MGNIRSALSFAFFLKKNLPQIRGLFLIYWPQQDFLKLLFPIQYVWGLSLSLLAMFLSGEKKSFSFTFLECEICNKFNNSAQQIKYKIIEYRDSIGNSFNLHYK